MPPKSRAAAPSKTTPPIQPDSSLTNESFAAELSALAAQAREDASLASRFRAAADHAAVYSRAVLLLVLAAASANASLAALTPVYGAIPAEATHDAVIVAACFLGWSANLHLQRLLPKIPPIRHRLALFAWTAPTLVVGLPLAAAALLVLQYYLSSIPSARYGPLVVESLTLVPLVGLVAAAVATELDAAPGLADLAPRLPAWLTDAAPGMGAWTVFSLARRATAGPVACLPATRVLRQLVLALAYAAAVPSRLAALALPLLLHTAVFNVHLVPPTTALAARALDGVNSALARAALHATPQPADEWVMLARRESDTGYLAVLDNRSQGFRVLRCDHSLLGGEWLHFPADPVAEPIYGVFVMLEAVRLVEVAAPVADADARALVIGLGIGTAPAALVAHGIDTTVVEIDAEVHALAAAYFHLPTNHTAVVEDAVTFAAREAAKGPGYDYIVHDVFTGGAEPIALFTLEFLEDLRSLLRPGGVIAINYAGDLALAPIRAVVYTIRAVFPACRVFREHPADADDATDFANVVIFCTRDAAPVRFRAPTPADLLNSETRRRFLVPQYEVTEADFRSTAAPQLVRRNDTTQLSKWHQKSAIGHWEVMRGVLPSRVWELW